MEDARSGREFRQRPWFCPSLQGLLMSADPPAHMPVLDNSHQQCITCSFRRRPASALEVGSIAFGQGILGPGFPEHSLERVSGESSEWGHQVRLRVVPWLPLLNRKGVAGEGPEENPLRQGLQSLGPWVSLFAVCSMELQPSENGLTRSNVAILSSSREADRSRDHEYQTLLKSCL